MTVASPVRTDRERRRSIERRLEALFPRLVGAVRRHLEYHEALGEFYSHEELPSDLAVEAAARALRRWREAPEGRAFYPWLCRIAFQVVEETLERHRLEHRVVARSLDEPIRRQHPGEGSVEAGERLAEVLPAPGPLPDEAVERRAFQRYLLSTLRTLPREEALAFLYHDVERLPYREVARMLQSEERAVRNAARRARAHLAAALVREGWVTAVPPGALFRRGAPPSAERRRDWLRETIARAEQGG